MRDLNRIPIILKRLEEIWVKHPDLRLGQLILNCVESYGMEDEELMVRLEKMYDKNNR